MKTTADLFQKTVHKIERKRLDAIERWMERCLKIAGIDPDELKDKRADELYAYLQVKYSVEIKHVEREIKSLSDIETHQLLINGQQIGPTLKIRHAITDRKITLTVTESLPEVREVTE